MRNCHVRLLHCLQFKGISEKALQKNDWALLRDLWFADHPQVYQPLLPLLGLSAVFRDNKIQGMLQLLRCCTWLLHLCDCTCVTVPLLMHLHYCTFATAPVSLHLCCYSCVALLV